MRPVGLDAELGEQVERVLGDMVAVAVVDVDAVVGDLDAEVRVASLAPRSRATSAGLLRKRPPVAQRHQAGVVALRQAAVLACGVA